METSRWLDSYTKAIFVEFNVYNANVNLFCLVTFILETTMIGKACVYICVVETPLVSITGKSIRLYLLTTKFWEQAVHSYVKVHT